MNSLQMQQQARVVEARQVSHIQSILAENRSWKSKYKDLLLNLESSDEGVRRRVMNTLMVMQNQAQYVEGLSRDPRNESHVRAEPGPARAQGRRSVRVFYPNMITHDLVDVQAIDRQNGEIFVVRPTFGNTAAGVNTGDQMFKTITDGTYASELSTLTLAVTGTGPYVAAVTATRLPCAPARSWCTIPACRSPWTTATATSSAPPHRYRELRHGRDLGQQGHRLQRRGFRIRHDRPGNEPERHPDREHQPVDHPRAGRPAPVDGPNGRCKPSSPPPPTWTWISPRPWRTCRLLHQTGTRHLGHQQHPVAGRARHEPGLRCDRADELLASGPLRGNRAQAQLRRIGHPGQPGSRRRVVGSCAAPTPPTSGATATAFSPSDVVAPIGPHKIGTLRDGTVAVIKVPSMNRNTYAIGFKGYVMGDAATILAEWIPLYATPVFQSPTLVNSQGLTSMYALEGERHGPVLLHRDDLVVHRVSFREAGML